MVGRQAGAAHGSIGIPAGTAWRMMCTPNGATALPAFLIPLPGWSRMANPASTGLLQAWGVDLSGNAPITVDGIILQPKTEFHLTLANSALVAELAQAVPGDALAWLQAVWAAGDTRILPTGLYTLLHKRPDRAPWAGGSWSLVETVIVPGQEAFLRRLEKQLGRQLPRPPAHVTTQVAGRPEGIGLARKSLLCRYRSLAGQVGKTPIH